MGRPPPVLPEPGALPRPVPQTGLRGSPPAPLPLPGPRPSDGLGSPSGPAETITGLSCLSWSAGRAGERSRPPRGRWAGTADGDTEALLASRPSPWPLDPAQCWRAAHSPPACLDPIPGTHTPRGLGPLGSSAPLSPSGAHCCGWFRLSSGLALRRPLPGGLAPSLPPQGAVWVPVPWFLGRGPSV